MYPLTQADVHFKIQILANLVMMQPLHRGVPGNLPTGVQETRLPVITQDGLHPFTRNM